MTSDIEDELQLHDQDDTLQQEQVDIEEEENPINKEKDPNKTQEIDRPLIVINNYVIIICYIFLSLEGVIQIVAVILLLELISHQQYDICTDYLFNLFVLIIGGN